MSNNFGYLDIILLAMIAGFIVLRLRSILGRKTGHQNKVESYDGSSFTNESTMVTGSNYLQGGGTSAAGLVQGGSGPAGSGPNQALNRSEEWTDPSAGTRSMDVS